MKKIIPFIIIALLANSTFAQFDVKAKKILDQVASNYKNLKNYKATFSYNMKAPLMDMDETQSGTITVAASKFRLKLEGQEVIVDGKTNWTILHGDEKEVNVLDYEPEEGEITPQNIYTMYKSGYKYLYNSSKVENGVTYDVIDLSPEDKDNDFYKVRITINQTTRMIKKWKIFERSGARYTYSIKTFKKNLDLPSSTFSFDKVKFPGYSINDLR